MKLLFSILILYFAYSALSAVPLPPSRYYVEFNFEVPQWTQSKLPKVVEPVAMWYDAENEVQRIDFYGGIDQTFVKKVGDKKFDVYHIVPSVNKKICFKGSLEVSLISAFPSNLKAFEFKGRAVINNKTVDVYNSNSPINGATNNYTYYVNSETQHPVQFNYVGFSSSMAGYLHSPNYDWFISEYTNYLPGFYNASDFSIPSICNGVEYGKIMTPVQRLAHMFHFSADELFEDFTKAHDKVYETIEELQQRKSYFIDNLSKIVKHRWEYNGGSHSHLLGVNSLADRSPEELKSSCFKKNHEQKPSLYHQKSGKALPTSVDWRTKGAVSPIKDQGDCGSCWSFSATGAVESANFLKNGRMDTVSEQYLLDCTWSVGNQACDGGDPRASYGYVIKNNGGQWPSEQDYNYKMNPQFCQTVKGNITIVNQVAVKANDEQSLMDALATVGPVSICVDSTGWTFYHQGVFDDPSCSSNPDDQDHCVLAVGYGTDAESGKDYWIIKNQWSEFWGESGYIRVARKDNRCGVEDEATYPIVK
eukprot:TRINITY_DN1548_c0_g1_i1.p1 TRINITY_DN1548_c0_g1~~TRINITY_DN1548_c0_g1_i1.p1  ORF type:complete len:533 (-),score=139.76 TRINITY_DN1548_c0_g1_i1:44-1642(-)